MMKKLPLRKNESAFIMPVLLFTVVMISLMITYVASLATTNYNLAIRESYKVNAQLTADAGLDAGINELNLDQDWLGSGGEITVLNTPKLRTTYETTVIDGATDDEKVLSVVARAYAPSTATSHAIERRYELDLKKVTSGTSFTSVVSGVGGLVMQNNSKVTGGDVVINGTINMQNNSQIGTQSNSVNVRVAHQSCPLTPDNTYPQLCGPGNGEPIFMQNESIIYADVRANNQTTGTNMSNPGLILNETVPGGSGPAVEPIPMPTYDRASHPVATTRNATDAGISCPSNNGSITWPADVKIIGDVDMQNNCEITITGNVWITGKLNTGNSGKLIVADTLGTTRPVIMVDGQNGFKIDNNGQIVPNSSGTGVEIWTFWSGSSCSPDCTDVTGVDLANSQNQVTIDLDNNAQAPSTVLVAQWSRVKIQNNGAIGAIAGQSIELDNGAVINFSASVPGSDNLTVTWVKRGYIRVFD